MATRSLPDGAESFEVTVLESDAPSRFVLFAVGGGGDPERHLPLLTSLVEAGCTVVAPHFERLRSPMPSKHELLLRARRLRLALDAVFRQPLVVVGVGHSIGSTMLLALAGAQLWMGPERPLAIARDDRLDRLVLLAPATGYFQAPGALDDVTVSIRAWAGTSDAITPVAQAELLERSIGERVPVQVHPVPGAGHFSFMNSPPPHAAEPLADRERFLVELARDIGRFATA